MVEQAEATRWRVLLVDADGGVREQLSSAWVRGPLDLHHANDIATAARLHQAVPFDALLLDTDQMTGPGLSWCRSLRAAGDDTPLVMLSGHATEIDRIVGLEAGADDFVSKPVHPRELQARLQAIVRRGSAGGGPAGPLGHIDVVGEAEHSLREDVALHLRGAAADEELEDVAQRQREADAHDHELYHADPAAAQRARTA